MTRTRRQTAHSMTSRGKVRGRGFTLIELLVVVVIIGVIATILIPNLLVALQKAKQKRTMAQISETGKAMTKYFLDEVAGAAAGAEEGSFSVSDYGSTITPNDLSLLLVPSYIGLVEEHDAWGNDIEYYLQVENIDLVQAMAIRSPAANGSFESGDYTPGPFSVTQFQEDLVWADGNFIRWPEN